jgi:transmembrane sensor
MMQLRELLAPLSTRPVETTLITQVGEQRQTVLADRSRVHQNTNTIVQARVSPRERGLALRQGELVVNVAPNERVPFVVKAGGLSIETRAAKLIIRSTRTHHWLVGALVASAEVHQPGGISTINLRAGDIVSLGPDSVRFEQNSPEDFARLTAWQQKEIWLFGDTLETAVAEFNRYTTSKQVVGDARTASMRISGRFNTGDAEKFVRALRPLHITGRWLAHGPRSPDVILLHRL